MELPRVKPEVITKQDFLNYFKKPYPFWFLHSKEVENFFIDTIALEQMEELKSSDLFALLKDVDSQESLFKSNFIRLNSLLNEKLTEFYKKKFKLPTLGFHNHTVVREDATDRILRLLKDKGDAFIYKPTLVYKDLQIKPTVIYKHGKHVYIIEHLWSTSVKKEVLAVFAYYQHVLKELGIKVSQFLITFLSNKPSPNKELMIEVGNSIPFTAKKASPVKGALDEKLKNVNSYFGLDDFPYMKTIYEEIFTEEEFDALNNEPWEFDVPLSVPDVIKELREFIKKEDRSIDFERIANTFLVNRGALVSPETQWFKFLLQNHLENFNFSSTILPLHKVIGKLEKYKTQGKRDFFLKYISGLEFLKLPEDQEFVVFEKASERFKTLTNTKTRVYYDFESVSLPFPYLENTKPWMQIVLQVSLMVLKNGKESGTTNMIIDPITLSLDDFKRIIDTIYRDEHDVAYIVYNKSFENTRLKEMAALIKETEYTEKVTSIIDRTIDLADWFHYGNNPHIIHKKLQGFHSIKKVSKLISKEIDKATGTVQYSDLVKCQNGVMAQALLLSRALSYKNPKDDEDNWRKNKEFMYKYCENDVRSMWAVEKYIEELLRSNKHGYYDEKEYLDLKQKFRKSA